MSYPARAEGLVNSTSSNFSILSLTLRLFTITLSSFSFSFSVQFIWLPLTLFFMHPYDNHSFYQDIQLLPFSLKQVFLFLTLLSINSNLSNFNSFSLFHSPSTVIFLFLFLSPYFLLSHVTYFFLPVESFFESIYLSIYLSIYQPTLRFSIHILFSIFQDFSSCL